MSKRTKWEVLFFSIGGGLAIGCASQFLGVYGWFMVLGIYISAVPIVFRNSEQTVTFQIVIPVFNQFDRTAKYLKTWYDTAKGIPWIVLIDNGSDTPLIDHPEIEKLVTQYDLEVVRNEKNIGVYPTFPQGMRLTEDPWVFYSHSDVEMIEYGWDEKLNRLLSLVGDNAGVCGMYGARGLGTKMIYKEPYDFRQLQRWACCTVPSMAVAGGDVLTRDMEPVLVLDGFSLIVNRDMIEKTGGFDCDSFPVHHFYDNDVCLQAHFAGYKNYVLDIDCIHHGGMTSCSEKWAEEWNTTDLSVHRKSHRVAYEKYRDRLPTCIEEIVFY